MRDSPLPEAIHLKLDELADRATTPVDVAVIDSGIDMTHPDLTDRVVRSVRILNGEIQEIELGTNNDTYGHGTAVAGIIARMAPNARIHDIRVLHPGNIGSGEDLTEGLRVALRERKIRVINMSLSALAQYAPKLRELCDRAFYQSQLIVAARRNIPISDEGFPAEFSSCIGVDTAPFRDPFALRYSIGNIIEVETNGEEVVSARMGGGYTTHTGTSFATPAITGLCTLLIGAFPTLHPYEIRTLLSIYGQDAPATQLAAYWFDRVHQARRHGDFFGAFDATASGLAEHPRNLGLQCQAVRALTDARALEAAELRLAEVEKTGRIDRLGDDDFQLWEDLVCLRGRLWKERAFQTRTPASVDCFRRSAECYERALLRSQASFPSRAIAHFPAINAATMWHFAGETVRARELASVALDLARRDDPHYWTRATMGEASILLGDAKGADQALREARVLVTGKWDQLASTRRQLRKLLPTTSIPAELLDDALAPPGVICLLPKPLGPDAALDGAPIGPGIGEEIGRNIELIDAAVAFATLLTPRDVWAAEALMAHEIDLTLVLPFEPRPCCDGFVERYGEEWRDRYMNCIAKADRVHTITDEGRIEEEILLSQCGKQMIGLALLRGDALVGAPVYHIALGQIAHDQERAGVRLLEHGRSDPIVLGSDVLASSRGRTGAPVRRCAWLQQAQGTAAPEISRRGDRRFRRRRPQLRRCGRIYRDGGRRLLHRDQRCGDSG